MSLESSEINNYSSIFGTVLESSLSPPPPAKDTSHLLSDKLGVWELILLGLCSLVRCMLSVPDCETVWTRDEFAADCPLGCRRRICSSVGCSISSVRVLF